MAGIYLHIPFCKQACNYCNFYFVVSPKKIDDFVNAVVSELVQRKDYLGGETVDTIYFGGGTPSLLQYNHIAEITDTIHKHFNTSVREFTIEANPDDLTEEKLHELRALTALGVNRLSVGIQSFRDADLRFMNRAHTSQEAISSLKRIQDMGFSNITIDLIYGIPGMNNEEWLKQLDYLDTFNVPHFSAYALTVEHKTLLEKRIRDGVCNPPSPDAAAEQFLLLTDFADKHQYEHYEVSNFATKGMYAIHNSNYWNSVKYLGCGPSAHSFDGSSRRWNISNLKSYIEGVSDDKRFFEEEILTEIQIANEYIMTSLRTMWGCNIQRLGKHSALIMDSLENINSNHYTLKNYIITLTKEGRLYADAIAAQLFLEEEC